MLERMHANKKVAAFLAIAAGGLSLSGCYDTKKDTWKLGVACPSKKDIVRVNTLAQNVAGAVLPVTCLHDGTPVAPTGMELVSGKGQIVSPQIPHTADITIGYNYKTGDALTDGDNPKITWSESKNHQSQVVVMDDVDKVTSVTVGR